MSQSTGSRLSDAMLLRQAGRDEGARLLLRILVETSADPGLDAYREALRLHSEDLNRTW